jgi:hypothetical protein
LLLRQHIKLVTQRNKLSSAQIFATNDSHSIPKPGPTVAELPLSLSLVTFISIYVHIIAGPNTSTASTASAAAKPVKLILPRPLNTRMITAVIVPMMITKFQMIDRVSSAADALARLVIRAWFVSMDEPTARRSDQAKYCAESDDPMSWLTRSRKSTVCGK